MLEKILIAYARGLCVVWNLKNKEVEHRQQHEVNMITEPTEFKL